MTLYSKKHDQGKFVKISKFEKVFANKWETVSRVSKIKWYKRILKFWSMTYLEYEFWDLPIESKLRIFDLLGRLGWDFGF